MNFFKFSVYVLLVFVIGVSTSQVKKSTGWKSPFITVDVAGSFNLPMQEAKGEVGDFFKFQNYGTKTGYGAHFDIKFGLGPRGEFRPYVTLGYTEMRGSDDNTAWIDSNIISGSTGYPLPNNAYYNSTPGTSLIIIRNPFFGIGFEYAFTMADKKKRKYIPFIGVEFNGNIITGIYRQKPNVSNNSVIAEEVPFTIKSNVRWGFASALGMEIRITKGFGMCFGTKYKLTNLIGKDSKFLREENKMNILDKADATVHSGLSKDRNIGYMEFFLGVSFFAGKTKK